jgi:omega-6 fatty acid desaturase (delta-12 desaturase)
MVRPVSPRPGGFTPVILSIVPILQEPLMRNGKELLIASREFAQEVRWRSWWYLGSTTVLWLLAMALTVWLPWYLCLPLSVVIGLLAVRMFVIYHDYMHGAILRRSLGARILLTAFGYVSLNPPKNWRHSHDDHHRNNCKTFGAALGSFPIMTVEQYAAASTAQRIGYRISRHPLTIALGYFTSFLWSMTLCPMLRNPVQSYQSILSIAAHGAVYVGFALISWKLLCFAWILPLLIAGALGSYLFYAQHNFPGIERAPRPKQWDYVHAALRSSSFMRMSKLMHWFTGNIGYHHVHHLNHKIPFYRLPEAMAKIGELRSPTTTSLHPVDIFRCLRLKLWDSTNERLLTYKQARFSASLGA